jgi:uncharacterized protein (TIGR03437 family)
MLLSISPANLPTAEPGRTFTVALSGSGFVSSSDHSQQTFVGIVVAGALVADSNLSVSVNNASNIIVTIAATAVDPFLPFATSGTGGTVVFGVCNPRGTSCSTATSTVSLKIASGPTIQAVTSAASYAQPVPPALPTVAPYDIVSIFGASFCNSGGSGCSSTQVLNGAIDPATDRYPALLSPDPKGATQRSLSVTFQTHATPPLAIGSAPLLFATNTQINLLVPAAVASYIGKSIDVVVNFGYGSSATTLSSAPVTVNVVAADPGIFTLGSTGQGDGAILGPTGSVIQTGSEAAMRTDPAASDTVQIYMTGLGAPDSTADNGSFGQGLWPADCVSAASFLTSLDAAISGSLPSLDGTLIAGSVLNFNRLPPCLRSSAAIPTVTIGGQPATVVYAGWVPDLVAGAYQINARLPGINAGPFKTAAGNSIPSLTSPVKLPVVVQARGQSSQPGVSISVAPR